MSQAPAFSYYIDTPQNWKPSHAATEISGWFYAGVERECRDIRAVIDGVVFYGIYGLQRLDVQQAYPEDRSAGSTGFMIRAKFWSAAREVQLQFLGQGNVWQTFVREKIDASLLRNIACPKPVLRAAMIYESLLYLYRNFHRESWQTIRKTADRLISEITLANTNVGSEGTFRGEIEFPGFWINALYDKFRVTGWIFDRHQKITQLSGTTGVVQENRLIYGKERMDVASVHPEYPHAGQSNYYGLIDIHRDQPSPVNLKIFAHLPDGRKVIAFARRMHLNLHDEHVGPVPLYGAAKFWLCTLAFLRPVLLGRVEVDSWKIVRAEIRRLKEHLANHLGSRTSHPKLPTAIARRRDEDPYTRWTWHNRLTPRLSKLLHADAAAIALNGPHISIVVPAYNTPEKYLRELLDSVRGQFYPNWELCIADDASPKPHVREMLEQAAREDARIRPVFRSENGHISLATNSALDVATSDYIAFLDHDDVLPLDALFHVAKAIQANPTAGMFYTDEDKIDDEGRHFDPQLKGAWSPEMAITHNYTHHLTVMRRDLIEAAGRLRPEFNGAQDIDLILRVVEKLEGRPVVHVPHIGYHWRAHPESTASKGDQKGYLFDAARRGISEALIRRGLRAEPVLPPLMKHYALCLHQLKWSAELLAENPVTIVIPTRNRGDLLARCLDSLARTVPREYTKIVVVDDRSNDPTTLDYLTKLPSRTDLRCEVLQASTAGHGFDYSRLVNFGSTRADTPLILHLNNDVEAIAPGWLEDMVGWITVSGVGVVGARLLYPEGTINHAGISLSRQDGLPHVLFERSHPEDLGYLFLPHAARNVSAVTGACLLTRTDLYRQLGGFDENRFNVAYNDVDYCLRAASAGYRTVISPQAVLQHVGSASRGSTYTEQEHVAFVEKYGDYRDPFHSEVMDFPPPELRLNPYVHRAAQVNRPFHALVVTHNLNFEGAPIFIFEYARYLSEQVGVKVTVMSPQDGPLRARFEAAGLPVTIVDAGHFCQIREPSAFHAAVKALAASRAWEDFDVVVANTILAHWAVHLAKNINKPAMLYIHESIPIGKLLQKTDLPATMAGVFESALQDAARVIFTAKATRDIFEDLNLNDNFRTLASWVDIERIEHFASNHTKADLRRKHGLNPDAILIVNIGSVCERKGQHIYVRAIDQFRKEHAARYTDQKPIEFLIVGSRPGLYLEAIIQDIELLGLNDTIRIIDETPDIYDFYQLADVLVCTSFEESFPRVLLEAMAFRVPIVSTNVNGIPEMLVANDEAYLMPAGDPFKLVAALRQVLDDAFAGNRQMTALAYAHAAREFHKDRALPRHLSVTREAFLG
jgi:GT2 family glycosyltransferase/glycosyltransferase involved in cell wall biosynthesis